VPRLLSATELHAALAERPHWGVRGGVLVRSVEAPTYAAGIALVDAVAAVADEVDHHPDIDIRWTTVTFLLTTHYKGGITTNDLDLADRIDRIVTF
jgi:4a-hydroxytetrahydrobiopterin dehydratase